MLDSLAVTNKLLADCSDERRTVKLTVERDLRTKSLIDELAVLRKSIAHGY